MRLTCLIIVFIFLQIHLDSSTSQKTYMRIKAFHTLEYTLEFIHTCDDLISYRFNYLSKFDAMPKLKQLLILSGDISLNPGPVYDNQSLDTKECLQIKRNPSNTSKR